MAATAHAIACLHHCGSAFGFHQLIIKWQNLRIDSCTEILALGIEFFFALKKLCFFCRKVGKVIVDEGLTAGQLGFGFFHLRAQAIGGFHVFELLGLEAIDFLGVADYLVAKSCVFFILASFELLLFEAENGVAARRDIEFDFFRGDFALAQGIDGFLQGLLIAAELAVGIGFIARDAIEVALHDEELLVALLENEKIFDHRMHGRMLHDKMAVGKRSLEKIALLIAWYCKVNQILVDLSSKCLNTIPHKFKFGVPSAANVFA